MYAPIPARGTAGALLLPLLITPHLWVQDLLVPGLVGALALSQLARTDADLLDQFRAAALILGGFVLLSESWVLMRQDISVTTLGLVVAFVWVSLRPWSVMRRMDVRERNAGGLALAA